MTPTAALLGGVVRGASVRVGDAVLSGEELAQSVGGLAGRLNGLHRVAVWATPSLDTCVGVAAAIAAGATVVPLDPRAAPSELAHVVGDSHPQLVVAAPHTVLPPPVGGLPRAEALGHSGDLPPEPDDAEAAALVIYTSGTTGPPKGAVVPRRAVAACLDGLADAWSWTTEDTLVHGLPLYHVHGLVLGMLGPLRLGCRLHHVGHFSPTALAEAVDAGGTLVFGVPTMWSRTVAEPDAARAVGRARLLVSGSAPLPLPTYDAFVTMAGHGPVERYGLTETLIVTAARADEPRVPGSVGRALPGVGIRLSALEEGIGEIEISGSTVFTGYLHRPDSTAAATTADGWFRTGDLGTLDDDGLLRVVGRQATDLIKTGGHRVGAGEIEAALLAHPAVTDAAVIGDADFDLGERVVAYVVTDGSVNEAALSAHAASQLAAYKCPREYRIVDALPRNAMGKVLKTVLRDLS